MKCQRFTSLGYEDTGIRIIDFVEKNSVPLWKDKMQFWEFFIHSTFFLSTLLMIFESNLASKELSLCHNLIPITLQSDGVNFNKIHSCDIMLQRLENQSLRQGKDSIHFQENDTTFLKLFYFCRNLKFIKQQILNFVSKMFSEIDFTKDWC